MSPRWPYATVVSPTVVEDGPRDQCRSPRVDNPEPSAGKVVERLVGHLAEARVDRELVFDGGDHHRAGGPDDARTHLLLHALAVFDGRQRDDAAGRGRGEGT